VFYVMLVALLALLATSSAWAQPPTQIYVVNSKENYHDANPGDGVCAATSGQCTLVAAIEEAYADGVDSIIHFSRSFSSTDSIHGCSLPGLGANTTIDASDQWDTTYDRPGVEITGGACSQLSIQSDGNVIRGLLFGGTNNTGIEIDGGDSNTIGGTEAHQRNVFISGIGIVIEASAADNLVVGNYFGTIDGDNAVSSTEGIRLLSYATNNTIENNVIVGHTQYGVYVWDAHDNTLKDNIIGANSFHTGPLPNDVGVWILHGDRNTIGPDNWIVGNDDDGLYLERAEDTVVKDNTIGYCFYNLENGGDGVELSGANGSQLTGNGIACNDGHGVSLRGGADLVIQGNGIGGNGQDGLYIEGGNDIQVGGSGSNMGNGIGTNGANGVHLTGTAFYDTYNVTVAGNSIGLSQNVWDAGNEGHGVLIEDGAYNNTIGGSGPGEGNWIAYNHQDGIRLSGGDTRLNTIVGNVLGAPINWGWAAPNGHHGIGIYDGAHDNPVGVLGRGNTIVSSGWSGVAIVDSGDNAVWFNTIGTDGADANWGNGYYGIHVVNGADNFLGANEIAYNGTHANEAGVRVEGTTATANTISMNSIHDNGGPGIELVDGGNTGLSAPAITQGGCRQAVAGTACLGCTVEVFSDNDAEGRVYEGSVTADSTFGEFSWEDGLNGPNVTATARDAAGNTSAFSVAHNVGLCNAAPTAVFTYTPTSGDTCTSFTFDASDSSDPEDPDSALRVRWDWDNDGVYDTTLSTAKTIVHRLGKPTLHTVRLQVWDTNDLTDETTQVITLSGAACEDPEDSSEVYLPLLLR
jgi:parallel beta-helix repeat protein